MIKKNLRQKNNLIAIKNLNKNELLFVYNYTSIIKFLNNMNLIKPNDRFD